MEMARVSRSGSMTGMEVLCGLAPHRGEPAVGRLTRTGGTARRHGACIRVCMGKELGELETAEDVGLVIVGDCSLSAAELTRLSTCPILMLPALPAHCMGQVAVLDTELGRLFICPDLPTVSHYLERLGEGEHTAMLGSLGTARADGVCLSVGQSTDGGFYTREDGCFLELCERGESAREQEELVYERCCELADLVAGSGIAVALRFLREEDGGLLRASLRGVFRAAVYGSFAVMVGGCLTEEDACTVRREYQHAFCELASEKREFNGYLLKGLLLENLLFPISSCVLKGWDFFCLDAKRLSECLTGRAWESCSAWEYEWQTIGSSILSVCTEGTRLWVRMPEPLSPRLLCRAFLEAGVAAWILPSESDVGTKRYLRDIWENTPKAGKNEKKRK